MRSLIRFLRPFTGSILAVLVLTFFQSLSQLYLPTFMSEMVDTGIVKGDVPFILGVGGLMLVIASVGAACTVLASFLSAKVSSGFGRDLRLALFSRVEGFSLYEFDQIGASSLITRTTNDVTQVQQVIMAVLRMMISAPMMCIGGIIMAVSKDAELSRIVLVIIPVLVVSIVFIARKSIPLFQALQAKLDRLNRVVREGLTGIRVIRAFNRIEHERGRFHEANLDLAHTGIRAFRIMAVVMPLMMLIMNFTTIAIIWFGGVRIEAGSMEVGDLMAFIQYIMQIMFSLLMVSMMFVMIPRASVSVTRIDGVLGLTPELVDPPQPECTASGQGGIEFRDVTFSYPGAERPALNQVSFEVKPGEMAAVIGGTGSGKSTLLSLILRFYDVDEGSILVDGVDVRKMTQQHLRARIGYVPQQALLFTGTISENIRYGREDSDDKEIRWAAEMAQADGFIAEMREGYESAVSQGGSNLSGGQKQRLAIARALVRKPEILILDDSFSALDFKTDAELRAALRKGRGKTIVLMVAQRVSSVMDADHIIVLDDGQIVGSGRHRELLEACPVYREIVSSQLAEEESA